MKENFLPVVFDCMIFLQGLIKERGEAVNCLEAFENGAIQLFVSEEILREIADVLTRPKLQGKFSLLTTERAEKLLQTLRQKATFIKNAPQSFNYSRDPKDEKYINLAVFAKVAFLVSRDNDLLDLMTDFTDEAKEFRQRFRQLKVIEPQEFLQIIKTKEQK
ncbi:MAG: putative toxin-antitoxin system toxin component, PIN family [Acidobacteria bacterium]|jgi:putative PIN family toxin of toxin-antitoxin system|nr:putative toxin-antitoxin system toxin component, PIN family [Acidobacteriota bacterium]